MPNSFPLKKVLLIAGAAVAIGLGSWLASRYAPIDPESLRDPEHGPLPPSPEENSANAPGPSAATSRPDSPSVRIIEARDPGRSPLADRLNVSDGSIAEDMEILRGIFANYRLALDANPVGNNAEITAQLAGRNARRHAPIPRGHPAIDATGQLLDRWGTPFQFHALSAREMEVRSAGPDREIFTTDDIVLSPGHSVPRIRATLGSN